MNKREREAWAVWKKQGWIRSNVFGGRQRDREFGPFKFHEYRDGAMSQWFLRCGIFALYWIKIRRPLQRCLHFKIEFDRQGNP